MKNVSKLLIVSTVIALSISLMSFNAAAEGVRVIVPAPFVPQADFRFDDGYYRTHEGHYYHYDRDRDGWHYGRNHEEGVRYERHHGHR